MNDEGQKGYLFDVNLHYPEELHDFHNEYALGPENKAIKNMVIRYVFKSNNQKASFG